MLWMCFSDSNDFSLEYKALIQPLRDDASPGQIGPLDAEAAVLQWLWQRVLESDLRSQLPILLWFTEDLLLIKV